MTKTTRRLFLSPHCSTLLLTFVAALFLVSMSPLTAADHYPPRISHVDGNAAYIPSGRVDWEEITVNTPMLNGDRVFAQHDSRLEIELGDANFLRLADETDLTFETTLEDELQLRLDEGVLILRLNKSRRVFIKTSYGSIFMKKKGLYRLGVDDSGQMQVIVRKGRADIETAGGTQKLRDGEEIVLGARYQGPMQVSQYSYQDEFDRWSDRRDARYMSSQSVAYLGGSYYPGVYELDRHGYWTSYPGYGRVWIPHVSFGWSPYRSGFWGSFGFGFGWTWISHHPWGWLPYHYGNWHYYRPHKRWCWIPGGFRHWSPHRARFYHGGGYVGWAPTPHRFGNNNVTVVNNNTIINRPPREGLTVVRQEDFGTRRRTSDAALNTSRAVVDNFRAGLPADLPATGRSTVRHAASNREPGTRQTAVSAPVSKRSMSRSAVQSTSAPRPPAATASARSLGEGNSFAQRGKSDASRVKGTSRVLRPDTGQRSESARPPSVVTLPLRSNTISNSVPERGYNTRRSTAPAQLQERTDTRVRSRTINSRSERASSRFINSGRSVERISRPASRSSAPAGERPKIGSEATKSRATPLPKSYSSRPGSSFSRGTITSRPSQRTTSRSTAGRSYSRPSSPAPSVKTSRSRSSAPSSNRSFSSGRSTTRSSPSRSYSRPSTSSRSSGSSGRSSAPSRGRSSSRSRPN